MKKLLIIDDEKNLCALVKLNLECQRKIEMSHFLQNRNITF